MVDFEEMRRAPCVVTIFPSDPTYAWEDYYRDLAEADRREVEALREHLNA